MLVTLHVQRYEPWQNAWARDVGAEWIKIVNPPEGAVLFPDVPNVLVRFWTDNLDAGYLERGREGGAQFVRDNIDRWRRIPGATAFELANEPDCNSNLGLATLNRYTLGAIEEAERLGVRLCILNLAEGNPSGSDQDIRWKWEQLLPCVKRAVAGGHYVGLHAYWRPGVEGPTGRYHALGRRKYDIELLETMGVHTDVMQVLINETGIDGGIAGNTGQRGWQVLASPAEYAQQILTAEQFARTVRQMRALCLFTAGYEPPWQSYDISESFARDYLQGVLAYARADSTQPPIEEKPMTETLTLEAAVTAWRWHTEEAVRELQRGDTAAALVRLRSIVERTDGLAYRVEDAAHAINMRVRAV